MVGGARKFAHVNDRAVDDPRLEIAFQDGRNYLRTTAERFDVITADPIHPWARGAAYLYAREYYRLARDRSEAHMSQGIQYFFAGDAERPVAALREAVRVMPDHAAANHHLATVLSEHGALAEALGYFQAAIRLRPLYAEANHNHGVTLLRLGRFREAKSALALAVAARPDDADSHHMYANALARSDDADGALADYRRALPLQPRLPGLHHNFATFLTREGHYREAALVVELGIGAYPRDPGLLRQLAWLLATAPEAGLRNPGEALRLARLVNDATAGENPACLDTLAAALAANGDFAQAVAFGQQAARRARELGDDELGRRIAQRLRLYRGGLPYRLPDSGHC